MEFDLINTIDLLLVPVYFVLLYLIIVFIKKRNPQNPLIQKYIVKGFVFKIIGGLIYALLVYYYWQVGDTMSYFKETIQFRRLLAEGRTNFYEIFFYDYSYFKENFDLVWSVNDSGFLITKISLLLSYFSFTRFLISTMIMATIAYAGIFKLFESFVSLAPQWHFIIACIVLFFPSINMYGSGILKDTICLSSLGWIFYCLNDMLVKKKLNTGKIFITLFCCYLILVIKAYIIACFLAIYCIYLASIFVRTIKNKLIRTLVLPIVVLVLVGSYLALKNTINNALGAYSVEKLNENMEGLQNSYNIMAEDEAGSNFDIGTMEPTITGIVKKLPVGIVATLFRPFVWEIRKVIMFFSAMESLFMLLFTLYVFKKAGVVFTLKSIIVHPLSFLFIVFALVFSGFVGLSTLNFGTLARYRIPVIPFYLMGFLLILYNAGKNRVLLQKATAAT
ncbi:MAG: hypothetical protein EOP53_01315 [Sphingobacteriales bacterium]|nr:MAG: hypothetical protein EOP53_01315 [Sphingobacteriales bacterium]